MPTEKKKQIVQQLTDKLKKTTSIILTDYSGLGVNDMTELRQKLSETEGEFQVVKNTLLKIALADTFEVNPAQTEQGLTDVLTGPTAVLFCYGDPIAPLQALMEFVDEVSLPKLKVGIVEGRALGAEELAELAKLPSKEVLIAQTANLLQAPITRLARVLGANQRQLVYVLDKIKLQGPSTK